MMEKDGFAPLLPIEPVGVAAGKSPIEAILPEGATDRDRVGVLTLTVSACVRSRMRNADPRAPREAHELKGPPGA